MINILKFIFSIVILLLHSKKLVSGELINATLLFPNGAIAVEFFFVVSGYYFANSFFGGVILHKVLCSEKLKVSYCLCGVHGLYHLYVCI